MRESFNNLMNKGVIAARAGNPDYARQFFVQAIQVNPKDARGWWYYAIVAPNDAEKQKALETVLRLDPYHRKARAKLIELRQRSARTAVAEPEHVEPPHDVRTMSAESLPLPGMDFDFPDVPDQVFEPDPLIDRALQLLGPEPAPASPRRGPAVPPPPMPSQYPPRPRPGPPPGAMRRSRRGNRWFVMLLFIVLFVVVVTVAYVLVL
jgi:hypothetical protein